MSANEICHEAEVVEVRTGSLLVKVLDSSSCSGCTLVRFCNTGDSGTLIEVENKGDMRYSQGDLVKIFASSRTTISALALCILIPLAILLASVLICSLNDTGEIIAAATGLLTVGVWYCVLYLLRFRLNRKLLWTI